MQQPIPSQARSRNLDRSPLRLHNDLRSFVPSLALNMARSFFVNRSPSIFHRHTADLPVTTISSLLAEAIAIAGENGLAICLEDLEHGLEKLVVGRISGRGNLLEVAPDIGSA